MILRRQEANYSYDPNIIVPAIYNDKDKLVVGNNGISNVFFGPAPKECAEHPASKFQFFAMSNPPVERTFFTSWNKHFSPHKYRFNVDISDSVIEDGNSDIELWEIFYVFSKRKVEPNGQVKKKKLQYTCLRHCRPGTLFCRCDTCGEHFVITPQTEKFYNDRDLVVPIYRCQKCIQKKRMRYAANNK